MREVQPAASSPDTADPVSEQAVLFRLERRSYALRLSAIAGLGEVGVIRRVPQAPPEVLGLTEWRGQLLTIFDLPALVGDRAPGDPACLVRLAEPLDGHALHVPAVVRLCRVSIAATDGAPRPLRRFRHGGSWCHLIDATGLISRAGFARGP